MTDITSLAGETISSFRNIKNLEVVGTERNLLPDSDKKDGGTLVHFRPQNADVVFLNRNLMRGFYISLGNYKLISRHKTPVMGDLLALSIAYLE